MGNEKGGEKGKSLGVMGNEKGGEKGKSLVELEGKTGYKLLTLN